MTFGGWGFPDILKIPGYVSKMKSIFFTEIKWSGICATKFEKIQISRNATYRYDTVTNFYRINDTYTRNQIFQYLVSYLKISYFKERLVTWQPVNHRTVC